MTVQSGTACPEKLHYHQYLLKGMLLRLRDNFLEAYKCFRNAQD
jgi:hypothetical protein